MWVPLHQHSQFSILDASCSVEAIAKKASEYGMPAVALTDHGNMYGAVDFYKACVSHKVKPLLGCEVYVAPGLHTEKSKDGRGRTAYHLTLIAKDNEGYHNLCKLSSIGFLDGFYYNPRIDKALLQTYHRGLICLSGCLSSTVAHLALEKDENALLEEIEWYVNLFGEDYYLELQRHKMAENEEHLLSESWLKQLYHETIQKQEKINNRLVEIGRQRNIKLVATNDTHYIEPSDWHAHEILLNIQSGEPVELWENDSFGKPRFRIPNPKRRVYSSREYYFKSPQQMAELFADLPLAISNTLEVADKCHFAFDFEKKHYPIFIPPHLTKSSFTIKEREHASEVFLKQLCEEGIPKRYTEKVLSKITEKFPGKEPLEVIKSRLDEELSIILSKGMCDYLLIVWDLLHWAKSQKIPVGPGRGSGAGSIILFLIGITDIEPLGLSLFFERFINPERISYPDIDVDICMSRRHELIEYAVQKYGKDNVAQIITFGTMKAKMTIKDVGRVLSVPLSKVNAIAKLVPEELNITLERALEADVELHQMYTTDEEAKRIIDIGLRLEGSIRNTSIHAAGIIISSEALTEHIPICVAKDAEMAATQYSMKPVELVGMLKMDLLGLKTLTSITTCVEEIAKHKNEIIDWTALPLDDPITYQLLQEGRTLGVFQMESGGMQELAKQLGPDRFEEIIAIGALYRPGPMEMIPSFINRKHKREPIEYDHPWMESILSETYGIMVYQEQVMQIASRLANYSLGEGDVLRKAMGKKQIEQMANERVKFRTGALENGIDEETSMKIFDKIEKFAAYGFNKSHAACYGYLTFVTAYLKSNYPAEWLAALMSCDRDDLTKVAKFIREAKSMNIAILPPDINVAGKSFTACKEGIRFALTAVKGVGEQVVDIILEEREKRGTFESFYHFFKRVDLKKVGKKTIELLVAAGCFDFTSWTRKQMIASIEAIYDYAAKEQQEERMGVISFFSLLKREGPHPCEIAPVIEEETKHAILAREKELLGFYLTGHPMDAYRSLFKQLSCMELSRVHQLNENTVVRTAFIIEQVQIKISSKNQSKFAILQVSDQVESFELPIWPELYEEKHVLLYENQLIYAVLQLDKREEGMRAQCRWMGDLTKANEAMIREADAAYDKAKALQAKISHYGEGQRSTKEKQKEKQEEKKIEKISIGIDLLKCHLSHILKLKTLLEAHAGRHPVEIHFYKGSEKKATLYAECGVEVTSEFSTQLSQLTCYKKGAY
jgi:DNA polymerase-3 subunit alpha